MNIFFYKIKRSTLKYILEGINYPLFVQPCIGFSVVYGSVFIYIGINICSILRYLQMYLFTDP